MADTHIINDQTESEQITLEQEAAAIQEQETNEERPSWLPDKFKSPEDLANAYNSLESKLGSNNQQEKEDLPPTETPADEPLEDQQTNAIMAASDEFSSNGSLSDDTYKSLEASGLSRQLVDSYIAGQQALQASGEAELLNTVGGREAYDTMAEWASDGGLSENQLNAYNQAMENGTDEQATLALDWLQTKYKEANGTSAALLQGGTKGSGGSAFESRAQVMAAMAERDATGRKRYDVDPAYRKEVERRLSISNI
jgi:hypothetical protein